MFAQPVPETTRLIQRSAAGAALAFANVAHFYSHLFMLIYPVAVLALDAEFGRSYGEMLTLSLPGFVLFGIGALPAGWLGDRWSSTAMMAMFFLGTGAAAIATGFARGPVDIALGLALLGLFASIYHPVGTAVVVANAVNRGRALGLNGVFGAAGFAAAPIITGALIAIAGWRAAFIVPGLAAMATGFVFLSVNRAAARDGAGQRQTETPPSEPSVTRREAVRGLAVLAVTSLSVGLISQAFIVGLPKLFDVRIHALAWAGLIGTSGLVTLALAFSMVGQFVGGRLADRFPLTRVYLCTYALMVPFAVLAANVAELPLVAVCAIIMVLSSAGLPAENSLVARYCPANWHATAYGTKFVLALGVSSLAVPMVGVIYDATGGFHWLFVAIAIFAAVIASGAALLPRVPAAPAVAPAE